MALVKNSDNVNAIVSMEFEKDGIIGSGIFKMKVEDAEKIVEGKFKEPVTHYEDKIYSVYRDEFSRFEIMVM